MTFTLIFLIEVFWFVSAMLLATEFGALEMSPNFALICLTMLPVVNTALWVVLRSKRTKKENKKFVTFYWVGSFSEIFKKIRTYYE